MKKAIICIVFVTVVAIFAWWLIRGHAPEKAEEAEVVASVRTGQVSRKDLSESRTSYGSVVARPGTTQTVSIAFEARVTHLLVAPGQPVQKGDPLVELSVSAATDLLLRQAQSAYEIAKRELKQTQDRITLKLATNQELNLAQKTASDAELQVQNLQQVGANGKEPIKAPTDGVVATVTAQDGQIVAAGAPLLEIVANNEIEVKIGVEPEDISTLGEGKEVSLFPVNQPTAKQVVGSIRLVTQRINPATRLVDVYVSLPVDSGFLLDGYVRAEIQKTVKDALVVPLDALLPEDGSFARFSLFTLNEDKAVQHIVTVVARSETEAAVDSPNLSDGMPVVTSGNFELEDGMAVEVTK